MRIILSRKGVDSQAGGIPSPILDDKPISLPIPLRSNITYGDLNLGGIALGPLVRDLSKGRLSEKTPVHLDPDLRSDAYRRSKGWRPIFGQGERASKTHLYNCGVTVGDLFLFYGWFRRAEFRAGQFRYVTNAEDVHFIHGWLQVGAVIPCDDPALSDIPWARYHPHFSSGDGIAYIASRKLRLGSSAKALPGAGYFKRYKELLCLTAPNSTTRRNWRMPRWFRPRNNCFPITYHTNPKRFTPAGNYTLVESVSRGQEFVLDSCDYPEAVQWARHLITSSPRG